MGEVACTLLFGEDEIRDLVLPDHVPVHLVITAFVKAFGLPSSSEYNYDLLLIEGETKRVISNSRNLNQALVLNGSTLNLIVEIDTNQYKGYLIAEDGYRYKLRENTIIGRLTEETHVDIDISNLDINKVVSRKHAIISRVERNFYIKDNRSKNGVFVNGEKVPDGQSLALQNGDLVRFGSINKGVELKFLVSK